MTVVATAGHVDHGKSALVRALTGMEPDRWEEERRRGLTIDLGYAWTSLPGVGPLAFVDVPGHRRFIGNMLSGIGPAAAVLLVVAADGGWSAQSQEHLDAAHALRLRHGLLVVTRSDLADPGPSLTLARERLRGTSLEGIRMLAVSARTGLGIGALREELATVARAVDRPAADAPVRLWIDRSFTVRGAGTVVTGTLTGGTVRAGEQLLLTSAGAVPRPVTVRGLQTREVAVEEVTGPARVALNLRGIEVRAVDRGQALLSADHPWWLTDGADVLLDQEGLPAEVTMHVGTAAVPARLRVLSGPHVRVRWQQSLPLAAGDRLILRDPSREGSIVGAQVLDAVTPPLHRSGAARRRAAALAEGQGASTDLAGRAVSVATASAWRQALLDLVDQDVVADPLTPGVRSEAALAELRHRVGMPDLTTLREVAAGAGLGERDGRLTGSRVPVDRVSPGLHALLDRLAADPFAAPTRPELSALGVGAQEVAAAVRERTLLRLPGEVLLSPEAPVRAVDVLRELPQPFTAAQARAALGISRRVAIALLEHLHAQGRTHRDADARHTVRS